MSTIGIPVLFSVLLILAVLFANEELYKRLKKLLEPTEKALTNITQDETLTTAALNEFKELLTQKTRDLWILKKVMQFLTDEKIVGNPLTAFIKSDVPPDQFKIEFDGPDLVLLIEIIAHYIGANIKTDFPDTIMSTKENPDSVKNKYSQILTKYFAEANELLGDF